MAVRRGRAGSLALINKIADSLGHGNFMPYFQGLDLKKNTTFKFSNKQHEVIITLVFLELSTKTKIPNSNLNRK